MRTIEKFNSTWKDLEWWLGFHKTPVWLVARKDDYCLSVIKPEPHELPTGTAANLYGTSMEILDKVVSSN